MNHHSFHHHSRRARSVFSLNGLWEIAGGSEQLPAAFPSSILVPSLVDVAEPAYAWDQCDYHWYRTRFTLDGVRLNDSVYLKIEQSMFGTDVWLNGTHLGGSISCYTSHEYPLSGHLLPSDVNELIIRVGAKGTLPPESAVGRDQEKEIYTPGIWGDVALTVTGAVRVSRVQVIPHIAEGTAEVRAWIQNCSDDPHEIDVNALIVERKTNDDASPSRDHHVSLNGRETRPVTLVMPIEEMTLWSPEHPFLYEAKVTLREGKKSFDVLRTTFGMREFTIEGSDFYLNGHKILLRGSNIAFHRFLADRQRARLPWDVAWIRRVLAEIPKAHHFNFFRNHLGQMYNRWYDIADEEGILIQNEWQFWCATGSDAQIRKEFTEWLQDNWNHPSIVMWDALNESRDETVQREIVPAMKQLDPTRPWESVDVLEEHPYIYSLGMVLNARQFGFSRPLEAIEQLSAPSMLNEFLWWWFNDQWEPTVLTRMVVERWMGRDAAKEEWIEHQSFLVQELIELFRRMRVRAIQPFVYLSNNDGPTAHWFLEDIKDLKPKPLLSAVRNAFAPFGISIELWDRHFLVGKDYSVRIVVFNDTQNVKRGHVKFGYQTSDDQWMTSKLIPVEVPPVIDVSVTASFTLPSALDDWRIIAELQEDGRPVAVSIKPTFPFYEPNVPAFKKRIVLFDPSAEIDAYLRTLNILPSPFHTTPLTQDAILVLHGNLLTNRAYTRRIPEITRFLNAGGRMAVIEPEYRVVGTSAPEIAEGLSLTIEHRTDQDTGGYDSYVFPEDTQHLLWKKLEPKHLRMFNGAYGGEIVGQYTVDFSRPGVRLASCGLGLKVTAASEIAYGKGKIILFRLQLRGRLMGSDNPEGLFVRRRDPVARQLLMNLLEYCEM